jgi:SRSO17 transposase
MVKNRWWVEHSSKELADEIALDHFEGRSCRGWHHLVALTLLACAFLVELHRKKGVPA